MKATATRASQYRHVIRIRSHALVNNLLSEAMRARVLAKADLETDLVRRSIDPPHAITMPAGFDPADIPEDALDVFQLATAPVTFSSERLAATLSQAGRWSKVSDLGEVYAAAPQDGSNNWAAIMKALDDAGYEGWGISEQPGDQSTDAEALKDLSERMDKVFAS